MRSRAQPTGKAHRRSRPAATTRAPVLARRCRERASFCSLARSAGVHGQPAEDVLSLILWRELIVEAGVVDVLLDASGDEEGRAYVARCANQQTETDTPVRADGGGRCRGVSGDQIALTLSRLSLLLTLTGRNAPRCQLAERQNRQKRRIRHDPSVLSLLSLSQRRS